ncbi:hypothetical protein DKP78_25145, partial [Enterococcus faecium]
GWCTERMRRKKRRPDEQNKQTNRRGEKWSLSLPSSATVGRAHGNGLPPNAMPLPARLRVLFFPEAVEDAHDTRAHFTST